MNQPSAEVSVEVIVTGASSGIGHACAIRLAGMGFRVYACARSDADLKSLAQLRDGGLAELRPIRLDVTSGASIEEACHGIFADRAERRATCPFVLVNNAGVVKPGPLEFLPIEEFREQLEVNLIGVLRVTQAFLPLIRESRGRVINISSTMGRLAWPFAGAYAASKFGLEGLSEALRLELAPLGVSVVLIEPGAVATPIWKKAGLESNPEDRAGKAASGERTASPEAERVYGRSMRAMASLVQKSLRRAELPETVAAAVARAIVQDRPPLRVVVGRGARLQLVLKSILPYGWLEVLIRKLIESGEDP